MLKLGGEALQSEREVVELWLEKTFEDEAAPPAARPGGLSGPFLSFPIRELHVNLFLMGNYLLFGLFFMCLGSFLGVGGRGG